MSRGGMWWAGLLVLLAACHRGRTLETPAPRAGETSARPTSTEPSTADASGDSGASAADSTAGARVPNVATHEVTREAAEIFGDSAASASDSAAVPDGPSWDIDVRSYETHKRVEFYVGRFTGVAKEPFGLWLSRGTQYESMIRAKLRAAGLPEDLTYLALIESGYYPHAYSRAAAVGLWQFMTTTARGVGMRVDWWVDERRDPARSTDGAVRFLGSLREQFGGSLYLAVAAYNGGPGRVARGLTRYADDLEGSTGEDVFFALAEKDYLRAETRDYVPKMIAAALVAKEPNRYGLEVKPLPPFVYDSARVGPSTPLAAVAKAASTDLSDVSALNAHVLRGVTPPRDSFYVRVPVGRGAAFDSTYAALPRADRDAYMTGTTKKGETMAMLASRHRLTVKQLGWYNRDLRKLKSGRLVVGQRVLVPSRAVVAAAIDVPDPAVERYGSSRRVATHVVRRGESLGLIARRYKTTTNQLMRLNGLRKDVIFPGQVIVVRGATRATPARRPATTARRSVSPAKGATPLAGQQHLVKRGESLTSIARRYSTTAAELKQLNGLRGDAIQAGQRLVVRGN